MLSTRVSLFFRSFSVFGVFLLPLLLAGCACLTPFGGPKGPPPAVHLQGVLKRGGLLIGRTEPSSTVRLKDLETTADENGLFVLGLARDAARSSMLTVRTSDGREARVPVKVASRKYKTQRVNGVEEKHVNPDPVQTAKAERESEAIQHARAVFTPDFTLWNGLERPVQKARISGVYGSCRVFNGEERSWHKGADMAAPIGTPIVAPADGVVRLALPDSFFNGNLVVLDHGHQVMTIYAHMNKMAVHEGDVVRVGDVLGQVGQTGRATGPHLHWGLFWRNMPLDPILFLEHAIEPTK